MHLTNFSDINKKNKFFFHELTLLTQINKKDKQPIQKNLSLHKIWMILCNS